MPSLILLMIVILTTGACQKGNSDSEAKGNVQNEAEPAASSPIVGVNATLNEYETIRSLLAADKVDGIATAVERFAQNAKAATAGAPEKMKQPLEDLADAAAKLKAKLGDINEARLAFGNLSQAFVALLAAAPSLRKGRYIFECPMAESYQKWVQVSSEMQNPYMGKKMLRCGSEATWIP